MLPLIAAAGISAAAGIGSYLANKSANDRAAMLQDQAFQQWMNLQIPDPAEQKVVLQRFVQEGVLDPKLQAAIQQDPSEFQKIVTSADNKAAQNRALKELEDIGYSGGLRLQDKAALQDSMLNQQVQDRGNRNAIAADMARRGLGGSGFDVAAQLQGQQGTSDQAANNSLKIAAGAQDRALKAIEDAGGLATQYRTQDFGEQAQKATAADRINQFNTQNLRDVNAANTNALNQAQATNLASKQAISNQNTTLSNAEQTYNKGLAQQQFEDQAKKLSGATGQLGAEAETAQRGGQQLGNTISNIGGAASNASILDAYFANQKKTSANGNGYGG